MILRNDNELIGDFIGTIPAMQDLAKTTDLEVIVKDSVKELFDMTGLKRSVKANEDISFDLHAAFALADRNNLHMIQANYAYIGLGIPKNIPRPQLFFKQEQTPVFDYLLAPFSRSLPKDQLWNSWTDLVRAMPEKTFALLGNGAFDNRDLINEPNCSIQFNNSMNHVCNLMANARHGLISVVTGISHLAYALNVTNYLFVNQGTWGKNPEAIYFDKHIPDITIEEVLGKLPN